MCIRDSANAVRELRLDPSVFRAVVVYHTESGGDLASTWVTKLCSACLLYTSDAADERSSVDLGGRRIINKKTQKKKKKNHLHVITTYKIQTQLQDHHITHTADTTNVVMTIEHIIS